MLASVKIQVDCLGRPATVEISTVIRTGIHDLDIALFRAMTLAARNLADEVNSDQERVISERQGDGIDASVREVLAGRTED